ncbi:hypothetical protein K3556_15790 (plasmid) [Aliiroseovarius sp. M344]|uniref:hypothetical protein n=1 Tax=Aliiroseovarius sp. M344 TaxID=2867010 RepID=UPI0021ADF61D|nr:hypothetical protein [Aliiroseovarius sp. M344]UWQ16044.1 hypothetical protein K3556_15790 [Aliiroseovarius sp. M344]
MKRSKSHYHTYLPGTLDMIRGHDLVFYSGDEPEMAHVRELCAARNIHLKERFLTIADLPAYGLAQNMVEACRRMSLDSFAKPPEYNAEKGVVHYWRDFRGSGEEVFCAMLSIWLSKVFLTSTLAQSEDEERPVAWVDASLSRFKRHRNVKAFQQLELPCDRLSHYGNAMRYYGALLPLNASFLSANAPVWRDVEAEFSEAANRAKGMAYGHDEETIFADCLWRRPELFHCIGSSNVMVLQSKAKHLISSVVRRIV